MKCIGALVLIITVLTLVFWDMAVEGLSPFGTDAIGGVGKTYQIDEHWDKTGEMPLWNPYQFSGTPVYHRFCDGRDSAGMMTSAVLLMLLIGMMNKIKKRWFDNLCLMVFCFMGAKALLIVCVNAFMLIKMP